MTTMKAKEARLNVRVDADVKSEAKEVYDALGIDLSTAINVFLKKSVSAGGFPFNVTLEKPNSITMKAIKESYEGKNNSKAYKDIDELWEDLNA